MLSVSFPRSMTTVLIALLSLNAATAGDDLNEDERAYLVQLIPMRDRQADELKHEIARLGMPDDGKPKRSERQPKPKRGTGEYREKQRLEKEMAEFAGHVAELRSELERLQTGEELPVWPLGWNVRQGAIGHLSGVVVVQVIGPTDMLVRNGSYDVPVFWLQGLPTAKPRSDERSYYANVLAIVDGTKTYTTVLGTNVTVSMVRPLKMDMSKVQAAYRARLKPPAPKQPDSRAKAKRPSPPVDPQKHLATLLANSRKLIKAGVREAAEKNLKRITEEAPGTAIAAEAQKELDGLDKPR